MKLSKIAIFIITVFALSFSLIAQGSYKVIVNESNSVESLSAKEASDIFLKKQIKWSDGTQIQPVDQKGNTQVRADFTENVHQKSVNAVNAYWQKQIFSGRGVPPVEKSSDNDVIAYVKANPGAIGYVSSSAGSGGIKVIKIN